MSIKVITDLKEEVKNSKDGSVHVTNEVINTITHLVGACFALLGAALLISQASYEGDVWKIVGVSIYGVTLVNLFIFSTLHHGFNGTPKVNNVLRTIDYVSVFLMIAGTVTPLVFVLYRNVFGWAVLGTVWAIAAIGIAVRSYHTNLPKYITNTLYIVLGWIPTALILDTPKLPTEALILLATGGIVYSIGFAVYVVEKPNPIKGIFGFHEIWHCLVVIASVFQYLLIYFYVLK